jgi:hypothetical protein
MKVHVRVVSELREYTKTKNVDESGENPKIIMRKAKGKQAGWAFTLPAGSIINRKGFFSTKQFVQVAPEAPQAIILKKDLKPEEIPTWDKKTSKRFIEMEMIKKAGEKIDEKSNLGLYLIAMLVIGNIVITFFLLRGAI